MRTSWTANQIDDAIDVAERILKRFRQDQRALAERCRGAVPNGYPPTSMGGEGRRGRGPADSTGGQAAERLDGSDPASEAFGHLWQATRLLEIADSLRHAALPPVRARSDAAIDAKYCSSCMRGQHEDGTPILVENAREAGRPGGRQDLCAWCYEQWLGSAHGLGERTLPDVRLVEARARGERLTAQRRRELLAPAKKGA